MATSPLDCICTYNTHRPAGQSTRTDVTRHRLCPVHNPANEAREWAYRNLRPSMYSYEELARLTDEEIRELVDYFRE